MLTLYDFKCASCGSTYETLIPSELRGEDQTCMLCGGISKRLISPIRSVLEGHSGHFPDASEKWAKRHEKEGRKPSDTHPMGW